MQLEYKDGGPVWLAGNAEMRRKAFANFERRQQDRALERKAADPWWQHHNRVLAAADRRIAELRRELRAMGIDPNE